jgi:hypothetical protein
MLLASMMVNAIVPVIARDVRAPGSLDDLR